MGTTILVITHKMLVAAHKIMGAAHKFLCMMASVLFVAAGFLYDMTKKLVAALLGRAGIMLVSIAG